LLGCNAGRQYWNDQWRAPFKAVVATAGFNNSGPSATNGGNAFVGGAWNLMPGLRPRSAKVKGQLDSLVFMGFSAGAFEIVDEAGTAHYASNVPPTLSNDAYDRISALQPKYGCYLAAAKGCEDPPPDSTGNVVHDYYLAVQDYVTGLGQEGAPRDSFRYWELTLLPQSLHLRRFQHDKGCFLLDPANRQRYAGVVGVRYDWLAAETTTRRQTLDFLATLPSSDANVQLLGRALRDLDPNVMPDTCTD
jgi:hypothetical protein